LREVPGFLPVIEEKQVSVPFFLSIHHFMEAIGPQPDLAAERSRGKSGLI